MSKKCIAEELSDLATELNRLSNLAQSFDFIKVEEDERKSLKKELLQIRDKIELLISSIK